MKALVYHGPGEKAWESAPDPTIIDPTDAIVRIDTSTICGSDLHILKGDVPEVKPGTILGHEAVGTVVEVGAAVTTVRAGDRVLLSCITSCGRCRFCKEAKYGLCTGPTVFATHHFALADTEEAYDVFGDAAHSHALKVVLEAVPLGHESSDREKVAVGV
jgi:alcohol dehydrogenase